MSEDLEQQLETWLRETNHNAGLRTVDFAAGAYFRSTRAAFLAGFESQQSRIAALEAERDLLRMVGRAADRLNDAWCDAINEIDDDNIVPTEQWGAWMKAHRDLNEALDALPDGVLDTITPKEESRG